MSPSHTQSEEIETSEARQKLRRSAKGTTCTHCRQLKLKCDSATVYPQDCSRCRRAGQKCVIDPTFRRRGNREYTQSLEKEVQSLRQMRERTPSSTTSPHDHPTSGSSGSGGNNGDALEDVRLSPATTMSLIEIFYTCYHPFFPILPDQNEFLAEYDSNRLLLWTVLAIASKGRDDVPNVYASLVEPVRRLAGDIYAPQSRSLKTMQALLLLCVWPFPFQQTINDPSAMYCSLATHIGYHLGLHRPMHRSDYEETATAGSVSSTIELKTWYGCFIVNQGLALRLGLPATIVPGNAIISALNKPSQEIPNSLLLDLNISYLSYLWTKTLGDDEATSDGLHPSPAHLMSTFETQAAELVESFSGFIWPRFLQIRYAGLRLQIYSFVINRERPNAVEWTGPSVHLELLLAKALSATITVATEGRKDALSLQYWPVFARYNVLFAACIGVYMAAKAPDEATRAPLLEACKNNVQFLHGWTLYPRDSFARISKHIVTSIRRIEARGARGLMIPEERTDRPQISSRMASNIGYQLIWTAKHGRTPDPMPPQPPAPTFTAPVVQPQISVTQHSPSPATEHSMAYRGSQQPEQVFGYSFGEIDDSMFLEDWTEADFTDIALDWQSMLPVPGVAWPQAA